MITETGFECTVLEGAKDDFELVEALASLVKEDNKLEIPTVLSRLIGPDQYKKLREHCRVDGRISTEKIIAETIYIMQHSGDKDPEVKN